MGKFERSIRIALDKISGEILEADEVFDSKKDAFAYTTAVCSWTGTPNFSIPMPDGIAFVLSVEIIFISVVVFGLSDFICFVFIIAKTIKDPMPAKKIPATNRFKFLLNLSLSSSSSFSTLFTAISCWWYDDKWLNTLKTIVRVSKTHERTSTSIQTATSSLITSPMNVIERSNAPLLLYKIWVSNCFMLSIWAVRSWRKY